jgi:hypothetical protein
MDKNNIHFNNTLGGGGWCQYATVVWYDFILFFVDLIEGRKIK